MKFQGVVLAGGKSSRFGEDKAQAQIGDVTMLERSVRLIQDIGLEPIVIANPSRDYSFIGCRIENDLIPDQGPLGGLYTACVMSKNRSLLALTCDMPELTPFLLQTLIKNHDPKDKVTLFCTRDNQLQPFPGIYESSISELVFNAIEKGQLSVTIFLERLARKRVLKSEFSSEVFLNVNDRKEFRHWIESCDKVIAENEGR